MKSTLDLRHPRRGRRPGSPAGWVAVSLLLLAAPAMAGQLSLFRAVSQTDVASAGVGGMRDRGQGTITLSGVYGTVREAYLYWNGPAWVEDPMANALGYVNGIPVIGLNIGLSSDNCWGFLVSHTYRANVTSIVQAVGNGDYRLTGFGVFPANTNGASLVVLYDDGVPFNNRDVVLYDGNDSSDWSPYDGYGWNDNLDGIDYAGGAATLELHVSDGQPYNDGGIYLDGAELVPTGPLFEGQRIGALWDIRSFDISSFLASGNNRKTLTSPSASDCVGLVAAVVSTAPVAAPAPILTLDPREAEACDGRAHDLAALLRDDRGQPLAGQTVTLSVLSGPNAGLSLSAVTDSGGVAPFSYAGQGGAGRDELRACTPYNTCALARVDWNGCNRPPDVGDARPSLNCIWPPTHQAVAIRIEGISDPDGDAVGVRVSRITSDEPTATIAGAGGVQHAPDAGGIGTDTALVRAERSGLGDGRVYRIFFEADDGRGGVASGSVSVAVPFNRGRRMAVAPGISVASPGPGGDASSDFSGRSGEPAMGGERGHANAASWRDVCEAVDSRPPEYDATQ